MNPDQIVGGIIEILQLHNGKINGFWYGKQLWLDRLVSFAVRDWGW